MLKHFVQKLLRKENLTIENMDYALNEIMTKSNAEQISAFLMLLKAKGETSEEIYGFVKAMHRLMLNVSVDYPVLDIVGTGGDGFNTVNISTGSALLAASCGVKVAKHGNRSVSSLSGSADFLASLGVNIDLSPSQIVSCIDTCNFGFFYAPNFHPALSKLKSIRKNLAIPSIFNLMAPLLNPASAQFLMIGISDRSYLSLISDVLLKLGVEKALVFNCKGLDEIACIAPSEMIEINRSTINRFVFDPKDYGFKYATIESLQGGSSKKNSEIIKASLMGEPGPVADTLILNAGLANYLYGLCDSKKEGIEMAKASHAAGKAYALLCQLMDKAKSFAKCSEDFENA